MTGEISIRTIEDRDIPRVKALWMETFEDSRDYVDSFFEKLYTPGMGVVAASGDEIAGHFFSLPGCELVMPDLSYKVSYLFSLATAPAYRGGGIGSAVARETVRLAFSQGAEFACLLPANETLYGWYERAIGSKTFFYIRERLFTSSSSLPPLSLGPAAEEIGIREYIALRERLLSGMPHMKFSERFLGWFKSEYKSGGFFSMGGSSCAAATFDKDLKIRELLCPNGNFGAAVSALAAQYGAEKCAVFSPAFWGSDETRGAVRPAVIAVPAPGAALPALSNAYWGFTFD